MDYTDQHWIPKSYLKAWCDPQHRDKVVHLYSADGTYRCWRAYTRIFSSSNLYTVMNGQTRDVETEKKFKIIEDLFLDVRNSLHRAEPLPTSTKKILAWYVASMRNRSPAMRDHWQSFNDSVVKLAEEVAAGFANASEAARLEMNRALTPIRSDNSRSMPLSDFKKMADEPFGNWVLRHVSLEAEFLEKMNFAILEAPAGLGFITSDSPVVWHNTAERAHSTRRFGLRHPAIEVTMPMSPQFCVMFDHSGTDGTCKVSQGTVDMLNCRTLNRCDDCFVAQSPALAVDWFEIDDGNAT